MRKRLLLLVSLTIAIITGLMSDEAQLTPFRQMLTRSAFPENRESRRLVSPLIMSPVFPTTESPFRIIRQRSDDRLVQFELRKGVREWYIIFRSQRGNEPWEKYPLWGRGTWIIKKDLLTGEFIQMKIFLQDNEKSFVRLFPHGDNRSRLDVHLFGKQLGDDIILPMSFKDLILAPFAQIVSFTDYSIDWELIFPNPHRIEYRRVETFIHKLHSLSDRIIEIDDAVIDGGGRNVFIESGDELPVNIVPPGQTGLNCSGYVKWIADGMYSSWADGLGGKYLEIEPLRKPTSRVNRNSWNEAHSGSGDNARRNIDMIRDPHFGLDWSRNLAYRIESARIGKELSPEEKQALDTGKLYGIPYKEDIGYQLEDMPSALYQLAVMYPGAVYLAAINSQFVPETVDSDTKPIPLHQYWHVLVLAPWFDDGKGGGEAGSFHVAVLDTGDVAESLLRVPGMAYEPHFSNEFLRRAIQYAQLGKDDSGKILVPEVMVHLVRMELPPNFQPPPLPETYE